MEKTLRDILLASAGVTALVSNRIDWGRSAQGQPNPRIVMQLISSVRDYTMRGASRYVVSRVQIDVYDAERYLAAKAISREVIKVLSGYRGGSIHGIFIESERDLTTTDAGEVNDLFRNSIDIIIHHKE